MSHFNSKEDLRRKKKGPFTRLPRRVKTRFWLEVTLGVDTIAEWEEGMLNGQ